MRRKAVQGRGFSAGLLAVVGCGVTVGALAMAGAAWACTPAASMATISPQAGAPGTEVTVAGQYYASRVEVHWAGSTGPVLGTAVGPSFSLRVKIPQAADGLYYVTALGRNDDGTIAGKASSTFRVTSASSTSASSQPAASPPAGTDPHDSAPPPSATAPSATAPASSGSAAGDATTTAPAPVASAPPVTATAPGGRRASTTTRATSAAVARRGVPVAPGRAAPATAPPAGPGQVSPEAAVGLPGSLRTLPADRAAASTWLSVYTRSQPGLLDAAPGSRAGAIGAAALSAGLAGLFGGAFVLTVARRRRVPVGER